MQKLCIVFTSLTRHITVAYEVLNAKAPPSQELVSVGLCNAVTRRSDIMTWVRLRCAPPHNRAALPPGSVNYFWLCMFWSDTFTNLGQHDVLRSRPVSSVLSASVTLGPAVQHHESDSHGPVCATGQHD